MHTSKLGCQSTYNILGRHRKRPCSYLDYGNMSCLLICLGFIYHIKFISQHFNSGATGMPCWWSRHDIPSCHLAQTLRRHRGDLSLCFLLILNAKREATTNCFQVSVVTQLRIQPYLPPTEQMFLTSDFLTHPGNEQSHDLC